MLSWHALVGLRILPGVSGCVLRLSKPTIRLYRGKPKYAPAVRSAANPGIQKRLEVLEENTPDDVLEEEAAEFEDMETDFANAHHAYDAHKREMQEKKEMLRLQITQRKYFKTNEPNLLTWHEKQQIKHLHKTNPDKWTLQALSQSFPVTELGIKRILKAEWKPSSPDTLIRHNKAVQRNWKLLREGKLDVPKNLKAHFEQFSSRRHMVLQEKVPDAAALFPPTGIIRTKSTEFTSLVKTNTSPNAVEADVPHQSHSHDDETFVLNNARRGPHMTLDSYRDKMQKMKYLTPESQSLIDGFTPPAMPVSVPVDTGPTGVVREGANPNENLRLEAGPPERIQIPSKLRGKASLYRLEDCYYDTDGKLLYRVPGMTT